MSEQTLKDDYKEMALLRQWEEQAQAAIPSQHSEHRRQSQNIIQNSIYETLSKITSLIHLRDYALYAWAQGDTIPVCTPEECRTFGQLYCSTGRASFNPDIAHGVAFCHQHWYQLPSTSICVNRVITIQRVLWRLAFPGRGLIFGIKEDTRTWSRIDPRTLE